MPNITHKTLIITRPREDAKKLALMLSERGFDCIVEPLLSIQPMYDNQNSLEYALAGSPQAILITSRHAVRILAQMTKMRRIPVIAVGKATADYALSFGFEPVAVAGGTVPSLITYALHRCKPDAGKLLYLRGLEVSADITRDLEHHAFAVDSVILYRAAPAKRFSPKLREALAAGNVHGGLFFSQRTAATYARLALKHELTAAHQTMTAFCLSDGIAARLRALPWKEIKISPRPDLNGMFDAVGTGD